jgi:desampylase
MTARIATQALALIRGEAAARPGQEVCGLLYGRPDRIDAAEPCRNVAPDPRRHFEIAPAALLAAHRRARAGAPPPIGCYHSHPTGPAEPSATDAAAAAPDGWLWLIAGAGEVRAWRAVRHGAVHGRFDPVALACVSDTAPPDNAGTGEDRA